MNRETLQKNIRKTVLKMVLSSQEGHVASSFSVIELLIGIYQYLDIKGLAHELPQHLILSKGHSAYALYGIMREMGLLTDEDIAGVGKPDSYLIGHVPVRPSMGFQVGTGSLGQGFPMALGRAYAKSQRGDTTPEFVIVGDGEFNEGSCWESLLIMHKFPNIGIRVLIDNNHSAGRGLPMEQAFDAIRAGWNTVDVAGHDVDAICQTLLDNPGSENLIMICDTKKGFPLSCMDNPIWHHRMPNQQEVQEFSSEIDQYFGDIRA